MLTAVADGAVVGSAIVGKIAEGRPTAEVLDYVASLAAGAHRAWGDRRPAAPWRRPSEMAGARSWTYLRRALTRRSPLRPADNPAVRGAAAQPLSDLGVGTSRPGSNAVMLVSHNLKAVPQCR